MVKILVTGANGQLGSEIKKLVPQFNEFDFNFTDIGDLDICNIHTLDNYLGQSPVDYIINCAAYTNVDKAESDKENAYKVNVEAVKNLAQLSLKFKFRLIHVSTDYVFGSCQQNVPFKETDATSPSCVYGYTKLDGELEAQKAFDYMIIRTSWLYSSFGNNFVKTMLRLGKERSELNVLFDQVGTPCYAADLANVILQIIDTSEKTASFYSGIYHYSNEGVCSWYDFAFEIMKMAGLNCYVRPIETKDYPSIVNRPAYSVMNKGKIKEVFKIKIPHWTDGLERCLKESGMI
jgi:dTDP-4-dehydrorhamnose reductase